MLDKAWPGTYIRCWESLEKIRPGVAEHRVTMKLVFLLGLIAAALAAGKKWNLYFTVMATSLTAMPQ
jgi:hypothetical protein